MSLRTYLLLAAAAFCCFSTLHALPMDGFDTNGMCQCLKTRKSVPLRMIQKVEVVPAGAQCRKTEILVTIKNTKRQTVCIDPESQWLKNMLTKAISNRAAKETVVPTVA